MPPHRQGEPRTTSGAGQSTVEFALVFPVMVLAVGSIIAVLTVCVMVLGLNDTARIVARAAATADDPAVAASQFGAQLGVQTSTRLDPDTGIITVTASRAVRVWFFWAHLSPVVISSSATILREPQVVLGQ